MVSKKTGSNGYLGEYESHYQSASTIKLLDKYRCQDCKKYKSKDLYSKKQLTTYHNKLVNIKPRAKPSGVEVGVRCRACVGQQVIELLCNGPCGLICELEEFSKNQRSKTDVAWCLKCTAWKEACEPEIEIMAAPNTNLSWEEEEQTDVANGNVLGLDNIEGDSDTDEEDDNYAGSLYPTTMTNDAGMSGQGRHAFGSGRPTLETGTSDSNPFDSSNDIGTDKRSENDSSEWSVADSKRHGRTTQGISYVGYDASGNPHNCYRQSSTTASYSQASATEDGDDYFTNVTPRKNRSSTNSIRVGKSGWAKSSRKTPFAQFPNMSRPITQIPTEDANDSGPDEM